jgi:hypothetical protein
VRKKLLKVKQIPVTDAPALAARRWATAAVRLTVAHAAKAMG